MRDTEFKPGKLDAAFLQELLERNHIADPRVKIGPGVGLDVAVLDAGGKNLLVAKTDPITFATDEIGWYAVQVNANDIVTAGARPCWFLATLLLPEEGTTREMVEAIYADLQRACRELNIALVGGHTEITCGLNRPIIVGQMLGQVAPDKLVRADGARPGDEILLTKRVAVEGTAILAREFSERLEAATDGAFVSRCRNFLHDPGISVVTDALTACEISGAVHAMHDPTEGGLATGLRELALASGCGMRVLSQAIPLYPETLRCCEVFGLDPLGLIASGSLLMAVDPSETETIVERLDDANIECAVIGKVLDKGAPLHFAMPDGEHEFPSFERDEIARLFEGSVE